MKNDSPSTLPVPENVQPGHILSGNENIGDIILKEAEENMYEKNWILNLAFIY